MYRRVVLILALAVAVAACGGSETAVEGVATLESGSGDAVANVQAMSDDEIEEAALAFTQCLRAEGLDVPDPEFDGEGGFTFDFRGAFRDGSGDGPNDEFQAALEVCEPLMEGVAQQFEPPDLSEIEDDLLAFAECMRDNGIDLPDPDMSVLADGPGAGPGRGIFGDVDLDPNDPDVEAAVEVCQDELAFGGPGRIGPGGGR